MDIEICDMKEEDITLCADIVLNSSIGDKYGFTAATLENSLRGGFDSHHLLLTAIVGSEIAGFAWIDQKGAFSTAPYLRLIAVHHNFRGRKIGSALLDAFEERTASLRRDYFLLVSSFNSDAIAFYEKHGYKNVGRLAGFAKEGIDELIMVKKWNR
ncbi:MAG: GNAT family N-acetyltransferase [Sphaerochaetaceae bacterium]|nr:GNAT family N-acetyltransferase [Sphaerochaetaceae bacterium]